MSLKFHLIVVAALCAATPVAAGCRTTHDSIGAGITRTECDNGYRAREDHSRIGTGTTYGEDNQGHKWRSQHSPVTGNTYTDE